MNLLENLVNSFNNRKDTGFSGRKLTAFWFTMLATYICYKHVNDTNAVSALIVVCGTVLLCLGLVTAQNLIDLKNGKTE